MQPLAEQVGARQCAKIKAMGHTQPIGRMATHFKVEIPLCVVAWLPSDVLEGLDRKVEDGQQLWVGQAAAKHRASGA